MTNETNNLKALNRHLRGWGLVLPLYTEIYTRLVWVRDMETGDKYPCLPESLVGRKSTKVPGLRRTR